MNHHQSYILFSLSFIHKKSSHYTYGPFSTLMERIFLKSLSRMFWHSNVNSQLLPWKYSSSKTVILNFPLCSISCCGFMVASGHHTFYEKSEELVNSCTHAPISKVELSKSILLQRVDKTLKYLFLSFYFLGQYTHFLYLLVFHFKSQVWHTYVLRWDRFSIMVAKLLSSVFIAHGPSFSAEWTPGLLTQQQPTEKPH